MSGRESDLIQHPFLHFSDVGKSFSTPKGPQVVVEGFELRVAKGEFITIIGHSGCGKSTILMITAGLNHLTSGGIFLENKMITEPAPDRGVVFQSPSLFPWMTALENVMLGVRQVFPHGSKAQRRDICRYYLDKVGLAGALDRRAGDMSAGMKQRVSIARAFALKPKLLLLDEPFGMLDSLTRAELQEVLLEVWSTERITALMITHDVDEAIFLSDRVVMMTSGPRARVGDILPVRFPRPRARAGVMEHPDYYRHRGHLIDFLEGHHLKPATRDARIAAPQASVMTAV
jgi:nitrate ABC transporter ATP-binding subunit